MQLTVDEYIKDLDNRTIQFEQALLKMCDWLESENYDLRTLKCVRAYITGYASTAHERQDKKEESTC